MPNRKQMPCGHWVDVTGEHPQRCPRCEAGPMKSDRDPKESRREAEYRRKR